MKRFSFMMTIIAGALMALAMPPTAWWPLMFPCLGFFYVQLAGHTGWRAFLIGWLFGFGYFLAGLYWIGNALLVPGNEFKWVWPLAIVGLPIGLSIFTGLAALAATCWADLKTWRGYCVFVICLVMAEWLRGHIFTGFPWNLFGYAWTRQLAMVQSVSIFGVYGLTLLTTLWATLPGFLYVGKSQRKIVIISVLAAMVSMGGLALWGTVRLHNHPTQDRDDIIVRIVQPNIPQQDKGNSDHLVQNLQQIVQVSSGDFIPGKTYAVIWPETAISDFMMQDMNVAHFIHDSVMASPGNRFLISGTLRHQQGADGKMIYYNSLVTYDRDLMPVDTYDKAHLVPFGEYIPFQNAIPMHPFVKFSGFTPGAGVSTRDVVPLPGFSGLVCYEVIFSGAVALKAPRPEWMVNVTNDGWYGDSPGPYQHLSMAIYRAVEEGLPLIRSANTGISAIIDPNGRVLRRIGYDIAGFADAPLSQALQKPTAFAQYGDIIFFLGIAFLIGLTFFRRNPHG